MSMSLLKNDCNLNRVTGESLFRKCSVATNPVMPLNFIPNPPCYYGVFFWPITEQFRVHSFHSATGSATSEYITVLERIGQNEEANSRNKERTKEKPGFGPKSL